MVRVEKRIRSEEVLRRGQHVLFVEGEKGGAVDPTALRVLLENKIAVQHLGPAFSIRSVAQALFPSHPTYYFLIDRDHHGDEFVNACWQDFPDPEKHNLLVWRKREFENYFLDPDYLSLSDYCQVGIEDLKGKLLQFASKRLFLDAVNYTITSIREELKANWIEHFTNESDFSTKDKALNTLLKSPAFDRHRGEVGRKTSREEIESRFHRCLNRMTGNRGGIMFGEGEWLDMIRGKRILSQLVNSECFQVRAADGTLLHGAEKTNEIVKNLLRKNEQYQPADFIALKRLIDDRS